jgi:hypothetical protein
MKSQEEVVVVGVVVVEPIQKSPVKATKTMQTDLEMMGDDQAMVEDNL